MTHDSDSEQVLGVDLNTELDDYLLHPQPQHRLRIVHAFMQTERTVEHVFEEMAPIENGTLLQGRLIWCIKQQQRRQREQCKMHFKLRAMFLYNMNIHSADMQNFLDSYHRFNFLVPISALDDVVIKPTIPMFSHLNALYIFYEASPDSKNPDPKNPDPDLKSPAHNHSKKKVVQIHAVHKRKHKNTRRIRV